MSIQSLGDRAPIARILHYGTYIYILFLLGGLTLDIAKVSRDSAGGELYSIPLIFGLIAMIMHEYILCERCMAKMPLNGMEKAENRKIFLRINHSIKFLIVMIAIFLITSVFDWAIRFGIPEKHTRRLVEDISIDIPIILLFFSYRIHSRLRLWCPWCRNDGNGGEKTPDPNPEKSKPMPI